VEEIKTLAASGKPQKKDPFMWASTLDYYLIEQKVIFYIVV
jgi:hypothetical protein